MPAATAGAVYLRRVLRSTPRLVASSFCDRPAYQWVKISITSIMSKVLLANFRLHSLAAGHRGRSFWSSTGQTRDRRARRPHGELRDRRVGNYVIANPSNLGNFMIADTQAAHPATGHHNGSPEHPVEHRAVIGPPPTTTRDLVGQQRFQTSPFRIGQIVSMQHPPGLPHPALKIRGTRSNGALPQPDESCRGPGGGRVPVGAETV